MNRILLEPEEIANSIGKFGGERAEHVLKVLHGEVGQILKTGEVGGKIGNATITAIAGGEITVEVLHNQVPLGSWVDIILAPPRPRVMKRLLPQLATLGVGKIVLVGAKKVEKDFWGATLLKSENYRPLLVDGLMQGGVATELPTIETRRNFRKFLSDELEAMFKTTNRVVAHPEKEEGRSKVKGEGQGQEETGRRLIAIGPEGGWTEEEVAKLEEHGFRRYSLGKRILRTDTATVALLTKLNNEL